MFVLVCIGIQGALHCTCSKLTILEIHRFGMLVLVGPCRSIIAVVITQLTMNVCSSLNGLGVFKVRFGAHLS